MKSLYAVTRSVLWGALGVVLARPALADARSCSLAVEADEKVLGLFPELPARIRGAFAAREGIDACARVKLSVSRPAITVEVILADGRSASRSVPQRDDVVPVLEALLLVPPPESPTSAGESSVPPAAPIPKAAPVLADAPVLAKAPRSASRRSSERETPDPSPAYLEERFGIELSVVTAARVGDGQTSLGVGALSFLDLWGWLVGFEGRADSYSPADGELQGTLQLAALGGHRFRFQSVTLDFIAGPAVALEETFAVQNGPAGERIETTAGPVPRLLFGSHLNLAARSVVRTFVGVEGEFGSAGMAVNEVESRPHPLPVWMVGLVLGATVGMR